MNQKRELIKNTLIISLGKFSTKVVSFILLPLYTALLSKSEYGSFDLLNTISIFLIPIITLQLEEALFRFLIDAKTDEDKTVIFTQIISYASLSFLIWSFVIIVVSWLINYQYGYWLVFYLFGSIIFNIATSFSKGEGKIKLYSFISFINSALNIVLNVIFIAVFNLGLKGLFLAYILSCVLVGLYGIVKLKGYKYLSIKSLDKKKLKEMIKYSLPLVPNNISWHAITLTDILVITNMLGIAMNGIYSVANRFPAIITTCFSFFNISWRESASKMVNKNDRDEFYNSVYLNLKRFLMGTSILAVAVLPFVFNILINKVYAEAYIYIPLMIFSTYYSSMSNFSTGIFAAYKDNQVLAPTTFAAAIINLVLSLALIKPLGLFGPIIGTLVAYFIVNKYRDYKLKKYFIVSKDKYKYISLLIFGLVCLLYYSDNYLLYTLGLVISGWYFCYINKNLIKEFFNRKNFKFLKRFKKRGEVK